MFPGHIKIWEDLRTLSGAWYFVYPWAAVPIFIAAVFLGVAMWLQYRDNGGNTAEQVFGSPRVVGLMVTFALLGPTAAFGTYFFPRWWIERAGATSLYSLSPYGLTLVEEAIQSIYTLAILGLVVIVGVSGLGVSNSWLERKSKNHRGPTGFQKSQNNLGRSRSRPGSPEHNQNRANPEPVVMQASGEDTGSTLITMPVQPSTPETSAPAGMVSKSSESSALSSPAVPVSRSSVWNLKLIRKEVETVDGVKIEGANFVLGTSIPLDTTATYYFWRNGQDGRLRVMSKVKPKKERRCALLRYNVEKAAWTSHCPTKKDEKGEIYLLRMKYEHSIDGPHVFSKDERFGMGGTLFVVHDSGDAS